MKQKDEVKAFKRELGNYRFYQRRVKDLTFMIEMCYHMLGGLHSPSLDGPPVHGPANKDAEYRLREEIERHQKNLNKAKGKIEDIEEILTDLPADIRDAVTQIYADGRTVLSVSVEMSLSNAGLVYRMNKQIFESIRKKNSIK